ncbi:hypothetical protein [Streptomyces pyxinicus]|uniref:ATP-dependent DNA ligase n=1 Tax=Streptomyces pyxinicus TaxID=2970331 RepID=UPI00286800DC|nr:hypothetical protein [Streptomyces sp. LP11]
MTALPEERRRLLRPAPPGAEVAASPMLATLSDRREFDDGRLFERKLDGVRLPAVREGGTVRLLSRTGQRLDAACREIVASLAAQECPDFTVDGEVAAFSGGVWA